MARPTNPARKLAWARVRRGPTAAQSRQIGIAVHASCCRAAYLDDRRDVRRIRASGRALIIKFGL